MQEQPSGEGRGPQVVAGNTLRAVCRIQLHQRLTRPRAKGHVNRSRTCEEGGKIGSVALTGVGRLAGSCISEWLGPPGGGSEAPLAMG